MAPVKHNVLGVLVDSLDEEAAAARVMDAARHGGHFAGAALAVHGVMTAVGDPTYRRRINDMDLVTPDGQPVRWALNLLYHCHLAERVYGPALMQRLLRMAAAEGIGVFLYGSESHVLSALEERICRDLPDLRITGTEPSKFRPAEPAELDEIAGRIAATGAGMVFVGLGCPRQEIFAHAMRPRLAMPVMAVGAAFEYHAGLRRQPPASVQRAGLQWLWRLIAEPRRLWRRYLLLNPLYAGLLGLQAARLWRPSVEPSPLDAFPLEGDGGPVAA
ncbi:MAG: WecB/TagA/CpsF family glycosyltransferase [Acidimicrobiales bacterium]